MLYPAPATPHRAKLWSGETWKTYKDNLLEVFRNLGEAGQFTDVTLVSEDQSMKSPHERDQTEIDED